MCFRLKYFYSNNLKHIYSPEQNSLATIFALQKILASDS